MNYKQELKDLVDQVLQMEKVAVTDGRPHNPAVVVYVNGDYWDGLRDTVHALKDEMDEDAAPVEIEGHRFTHPAHIQFCREADDAGYDVEYYEGPVSWKGPAVRVEDRDDMSEFEALISVPLQRDNMGLGYIVYPMARGVVEKVS